jgi:hypothetical protein
MSYEWTPAEILLIRMWMAEGLTQAQAERRLLKDLEEAAEEDGYDGP